MIFAVVSDTVWQALIAAVLAVVLALVNLHIGKKAAKQVEKAADKVEAVKTTLETATKSTDLKLDQIHAKVNGHMTVQLKLMVMTARRLADTTNEASDIKGAQMAETALADHEKALGLSRNEKLP